MSTLSLPSGACRKHSRTFAWLLCLTAGFLLAALAPAAGSLAADTVAKPAANTEVKPGADPATKWESQIQEYEKKDKASPPPADGVLFIGSSTIRMWKGVEDDFTPMKAFGRGVGGCQVSDMVYYADRIAIPYKPRQIVFYAGDNDLWSKKDADRVLADFKAFVEKVRAALPDVKIHFIAIKPSPSRERVWPEVQKANRLVREYTEKTPGLGFIDTATPMLGPDGKPKADLFLKDMLHMNRSGYELWIPIVKAALEKAARPAVAPAPAAKN